MRLQNLGPDEWKQVFDLLDSVLDLPESGHAAWLNRIAESHAALEPALRELLEMRASRETQDFLERLPQFTVTNASALFSSLHTPAPGRQIGPYKLIRELGQGGMGSVWLAERSDGTFKRSVALKLPHVTWSETLSRHFRRERDILASLEHPNIARLYEAGTDEEGRPFLAMQYVEGRPIDQYCREKNLPLRECLQLMVAVARAVAHAHARLIVHRDIKPGNILVSADGTVHLLDFGVAKLLAEDANGQSHVTQWAVRAFTPDYAAPEQIMGEPVTTATDVYSLAVVTYELLAGSRPYRLKHRTAAELERAIAEVDVAPASGMAVSPARKRELRGDLDAILGKAMKREPGARYPTAEAFASDLQRYLSSVPVLARPDSAIYRSRKYLVRHRRPLAAMAVAFAALTGASIASLWQARVADEQRMRALKLLERSEAVTDFVSQMLTEVASPGQPITIDELLARSESLIATTVTENPEHQAVILQALASYYESLGNPSKAEPLFRRALSFAAASDDRGLRAKLACQSAYVTSLSGGVEAAKKTIERELADPLVPADARAKCLRSRAYIAENTNDGAGALRYAWQAWHQQQKLQRRDPLTEAGILGDIAYAYTHVGDAAQAERYYAASLSKYIEIGRGEHPAANSVRNQWGVAKLATGDIRNALTQFTEAIEIARRHAAGAEAPSAMLYNRAWALLDTGRFDEALTGFDLAAAAARRSGNASIVAFAAMGKSRVYSGRGELALAQQFADEASAQLGKSLAADGPIGTGTQILRARISAAQGDLATAAAIYTQLISFWQSRGMAAAAQMAAALRGRADILLRQGKSDAALKDAEQALEIARKLQGRKPYSSLVGVAELLRSRIYAEQGRRELAAATARLAFAQLSNTLGPQSPDTRMAAQLSEPSRDL
jgi:eukaryotic-like serine/threonine-protein kinase